MPALNFQKQFAFDVESGKKRQTIRAIRKNKIKKGDTLYLFTGMRHKNCRRLGEVKCRKVYPIIIKPTEYVIKMDDGDLHVHYWDMLDHFAKADGFLDWREMIHWFSDTHGLPFEGHLIMW